MRGCFCIEIYKSFAISLKVITNDIYSFSLRIYPLFKYINFIVRKNRVK